LSSQVKPRRQIAPFTWQTSLIINIYDIFDTRYNFKQVSGHNTLYGVCRGRGYYYGYSNNGTARPVRNAGLDDGFHNVHWIPQLLNFGDTLTFYRTGQASLDSTNNEMAIWFANPKNLYHQPKVSSKVRAHGRISYNLLTRAYEVSVDENFYVESPWVFSLPRSSTSREIAGNASGLKNGWIINQLASVVMVYPLISSSGTHVAFLFKPLGIDTLDFKTEVFNTQFLATTTIMAKAEYASNFSAKYRELPLMPPGSQSSSYASVYDVAKFMNIQPKINDRFIPKRVVFFCKDTVNGVRSFDSSTTLRIYKNKTNANLYFGLEG